ncbi:MAG: hypothetical protein HY331_04660 [Chloroflexi bacterium]|nr:hypothetical protein [Chloroflexota bacterium]
MQHRIALSWLGILLLSVLAAVPLLAAGVPYGKLDWTSYSSVYGGPAPLAQSTFDADSEGWAIVGDAQGGSGRPDHHLVGGNPGGYISASDDVSGGTWYFRAPQQFHGDFSGAYGYALTFDLRQSALDEQFVAPDVMLSGGGLTLVHNAGRNPGLLWTSYSVPLSEDGWRHQVTGLPVDREGMLRVLSSVTDLRIRGEYRTGSDTGSLDNVVIRGVGTPPPPPPPPPPSVKNEVFDLETSNVTDVSFTLSFFSKEPALATVAYWISGTIPTQPMIALDFRTEPGRTHWVRVGGASANDRLQPETAYQYIILLDGMPMVQSRARTGPTLGERSSDGVFGQVVDRFGDPVGGAIVYLSIENPTGVISSTTMHELSGLLSDVTREDGYWWIDLKAARTQDRAGQFLYGDGDLVHLEAFDGPTDYGFDDPQVGELRATPILLEVRPVLVQPVPLGVGWNAVGLPLDPVRPISVSQLVRIVNGDGVTRLTSVFRYTDEGWRGSAVNGTTLMNPEDDFDLQPGEGYFFKMQSPFVWQMMGYEIADVIPLVLGEGWNLVGVPQADYRWNPWGGLRASSLSDAAGVVSGTQNIPNIREIDRWVYGTYEGHVTGYPFNDFRIEGTKGYFIRANAAGVLVPGVDGYTPTPGGPTGLLAAPELREALAMYRDAVLPGRQRVVS